MENNIMIINQLIIMQHYASARFNKAVISVPRCCVLPEGMVSGLTMHGKPIALSRGATQGAGTGSRLVFGGYRASQRQNF